MLIFLDGRACDGTTLQDLLLLPCLRARVTAARRAHLTRARWWWWEEEEEGLGFRVV